MGSCWGIQTSISRICNASLLLNGNQVPSLMNPSAVTKNIAIIGGGPAGLFLYKTLVEAAATQFSVHIFETKNQLGVGMPYSDEGAGMEHTTNISSSEVPRLPVSVADWIKSLPAATLAAFGIDGKNFTEYKVIPRLLLGRYLQEQFNLLLQKGRAAGIVTQLHTGCRVTNITDLPAVSKTKITVNDNEEMQFDAVVICTGHYWPLTHEGKIAGFFDSPYPPLKLKQRFNHAVAIKGSSLTAIDALRTLARQHGHFVEKAPGKLCYVPDEQADQFTIVMYSLKGLLPGIRFYLDDPQLSHQSLLSAAAIQQHMAANDGFLSLDFIFEKDFKDLLKEKDPSFYARVKDMSLETFTQEVMTMRERMDPFVLFKKEYEEAKKSIQKRTPIYWKELLAGLSFAMNYPAKHFSAEDMLRLKQVLMPLISIVIAFVPQASCEELMALHEAGRLDIIAVEEDSEMKVDKQGNKWYHYTDENGRRHITGYQTYIDCTGQPHLWINDFPFRGLVGNDTVTQAQLKFRSASRARELIQQANTAVTCNKNNVCYLNVPGIAIDDAFRAVGKDNTAHPRIYVMAVPFIGGHNPDYSGLDFCEEAATRVVDDMLLRLGSA